MGQKSGLYGEDERMYKNQILMGIEVGSVKDAKPDRNGVIFLMDTFSPLLKPNIIL
jgi:hypothetical protein